MTYGQNGQNREAEKKEQPQTQGILDSVSLSQQSATLRALNPQGYIFEYLGALEPRERQVLLGRYGLEDGRPLTLETIGQRLNLTRERVRQIEKESLKKLNKIPLPANLAQTVDLLFQVIEEQGNIARETRILDTVLLNRRTEIGERGILFILHLGQRFSFFEETGKYFPSWCVSGFDRELFELVIAAAEKILSELGLPLTRKSLLAKLRSGSGPKEILNLSDEVIESYVSISKNIDKNAFQEWGLSSWTNVHPKDVGDKVYLVLSHHGKPEHYGKITEMINKQEFDARVAHKETVHNELIKDDRFVLVGRGIYALREWGYKKGVVAEIIQEILRHAQKPLSRDEIIAEVMKQRLVKRNTVIVGLSNRKLFAKTPDNKYQNV